jgi:hypothetical protein
MDEQKNLLTQSSEKTYDYFCKNILLLIENTRKNIKEQEKIARDADAAVARLEKQLDSLMTFKPVARRTPQSVK